MNFGRWIKRVLTREKWVNLDSRHRKLKLVTEPPSETVVLVFQFLIVTIAGLTVIEVVHIVFLGVLNSEVFAAITALIGTVTGIVIRSKT